MDGKKRFTVVIHRREAGLDASWTTAHEFQCDEVPTRAQLPENTDRMTVFCNDSPPGCILAFSPR